MGSKQVASSEKDEADKILKLDVDEEEVLEEAEIEDEELEQPEAQLDWNNRTEESWEKNKIDPDTWPHHIKNSEEHRFLREVDIARGPIQWTVRRMFRVKAVDIHDKGLKRKEYIFAEVDWYGKNRLGEKCAPVISHKEGMYDKVTSKAEKDDSGKTLRRVFAGSEPCYYIRWNKKNVDALIAKSVGTDKETIKFIVKGPGGLRTDTFTYEQFVGWDWEECMKALRTVGGPLALPNPTTMVP